MSILLKNSFVCCFCYLRLFHNFVAGISQGLGIIRCFEMQMDSSMHDSITCDGLLSPKNHECKALLYNFLQSFVVKIHISVCPPIR
jgi:hypothetical protein